MHYTTIKSLKEIYNKLHSEFKLSHEKTVELAIQVHRTEILRDGLEEIKDTLPYIIDQDTVANLIEGFEGIKETEKS